MKKLFKEFTAAQLARLKKEYDPLKGQRLSMDQINKMNAMLSKYSTDMLVKLANADIPFLATAAKSIAVMKRGKKWSDFKTKLDMSEADELQCEACWDSHKQVGTKISSRTGKRVPNCVPKEELQEVLDVQESSMKRLLQALQDKLSDEGGAAGFDDLKKTAKSMGVNLTPAMLKDIPGIKQHRDGDYILEADLSKSQVKMVHKTADKMPKKDFMKRYGKDGDSVRYATATNMVKKKLGIEEQRVKNSPEVAAAIRQYIAQRPFIDNKRDYEELMRLAAKDMSMFNARLNRMTDQTKSGVQSALAKKGLSSHLTNEKEPKGDKPMQEQSYKDKFNATMKDFGIKSLGDLKSDEDKKKFFKAVDAKHDAKDEELEEGLTPAQKKLPAGLQKAILKKQGGKKEMKEAEMKEYGSMNAMKMEMMKEMMEMMKQEMMKEMKEMMEMKMKSEMKKMEMLKAEKDPMKMEMMKKEMMKEMMKEMKMEMMKKMKEMMKDEGFASDAQRKAAFASGYKEKGKKKKEEVSEMMSPQEMMKMNAMKMPIRAMYMKSKKEMKTGDDDMKPMASMKMNAVTDPKKMNAMTMQDPKQDMAAGYMKSDVRAAVKDGGGDDMSKVKDKPVMQEPMKKINAMYKREKYMPVKEGSIQDTIAKMQMGEHQLVEVQEENLEKMIADYLKKGGTISKLPPALAKGMKPSEMKPHKVGAKGVIKSMKMGEVREFVTTYNSHFLTNYKAEELMAEARYEVSHDYGSRFGSYGVTLTAVVDASSPQDAMKKGHDKLETLSMSAQGKKLGVDELQDPDDEGKPSVKMTSKPITYTDMKKF